VNRTATPTPFPPQTLADWCREDGHDGCAILIEESPEWMLPTVLPWVARHLDKHNTVRDEDSFVLPWILRDEAEARRSLRRGKPTLTNAGALSVLLGIIVLSWFLDGIQ
jgi:hypothetical protein